MRKNINGQIGEEFTVKYLKKKGYKILETNFHSRFGEIDIIARKNKYIAFVEVKTRDEKYIVHPLEAVTKSKQNKIILTAQYYLLQLKDNLQPRFDVASIICSNQKPVSIEYIENAFTL